MRQTDHHHTLKDACNIAITFGRKDTVIFRPERFSRTLIDFPIYIIQTNSVSIFRQAVHLLQDDSDYACGIPKQEQKWKTYTHSP